MSIDQKVMQILRIPKVIRGECVSCEQQVPFNYIGVQENEDGDLMRENALYDCGGCCETLSYKAILTHNHNVVRYGK